MEEMYSDRDVYSLILAACIGDYASLCLSKADEKARMKCVEAYTKIYGEEVRSPEEAVEKALEKAGLRLLHPPPLDPEDSTYCVKPLLERVLEMLDIARTTQRDAEGHH